MDRWQVLKDGVPVIMCSTIEEAEKEYIERDADEIRRIEDENE